MVFTSAVFLGVFLPLLLAVYFLANEKARPYVLLLFSILFYAWGEPTAVVVMLALMVLNYSLARGIAASGGRRWLSAAFLGIGVCVDLGALVAYKYVGFIVSNLMPTFDLFGVKIDVPQVALPIGISFYVFQIISYMVDVRRGDVEVQRNPFKFMLYVSLFPQLIAGPIVRYGTIAKDIENRKADFGNIVAGFRRFTIGLAKKVLVADVMASAVDVIFAAKAETIPGFYCWLGAIMYTLQIYFDFSGYSDMAIGLGRVFNFRFLENFDHPYAACSVRDFWRRWHISLSSWFRDYLYIPLGGNRKGTLRTYVNLFVVFLLCGVWHGAAWNFVVWGVYHGVGLVVERAGFGTVVKRLPKIAGNLYLMLFVMIGWVLFRAPDLGYAWTYICNMFGGCSATFRSFTPLIEFISLDKVFFMGIGIAASYPVFEPMVRWVPETARLACGAFLFAVVFILAMTSAYSPFIYFRF
ncbi:MAG: MBOAT family protein [Kiritimatiellae bacterium]|nr:MBOAT family protein [Kiritimatiellia bacterium]